MKVAITLFFLMFSFSTYADEIFQESAVELCQNMKQSNYSGKCLKLVKTHKFNESALTYCANVGSWNKIKSCLEVIIDGEYQEQPLAICHTAKYFNNEFKKCMKEIASKSYVSNIEVKLCNNEKSYNKKIKCLKAASSKPFEAVQKEKVQQQEQNDSAAELAKVQTKVKKAYELLRSSKTADATLLLHDLVQSFEK